MFISQNWLKDFVKLPAKISATEIAEKLTAHTVEVEGFINQADKYNKVVVGKVLKVEKHPNADRLRVALVDVKTEKLQIVCGAPNLVVSQLVPVALVGAHLPNGLEIKESQIRGKASFGMICAEDELGLGDDHEGIMVLKSRAKIGQPLADYLKVNDIIFEIDNKSLSNRPDLLGHYGLARELAVIFSSPLKPYDKFYSTKIDFPAKTDKLTIEVEARELVPKYLAVKISNFKVEDSPSWLQERLIAAGQKPINNIVDLTNYVMLECGQPLHAFEADKLKKIRVRLARKNETIVTLDGKERILNENDLVIADSNQAIAIAGVMGGKAREVDENTISIILEAANFKSDSIRKTAQHLGLRTEASTRFEKSLDPMLTKQALHRFIFLLKKIYPKIKISSPLFDLGVKKEEEIKIELDYNWLYSKIGQEIKREKVKEILSGLGFVFQEEENKLIVTVPSWRSHRDVKAKEDLVEEVLRINGYDNIVSSLPKEELMAPEINSENIIIRKIKNILYLRFNLFESYNYSFVGFEQLKKLNIDSSNHLKLANPLSELNSLLRQSLAPGLINNIKTNQFKEDELGFFEIGSVFFSTPGELNRGVENFDNLPHQEKKIGIVLAGNKVDLFKEMKSLITGLLIELIGKEEVVFSASENLPGWSDTETSAEISVLKENLGIISLVNKESSAKLNLKMKVVVAELSLNSLLKIIFSLPPKRFKEAPRYPSVMRDLCFVISDKILYNDFKREIINFNSLIKTAELFDVYHGDKLAKEEKSFAFHIEYQAEDKTLTTAEVDELQNKLIEHLKNKFEARLRDF